MDTEQVNEILRLLKIIADSSTANKIAAISMIVSGIAVLSSIYFSHQTRVQYIESLSPMLSFELSEIKGILFLTVLNAGQSYAEKINLSFKSINNNGEETEFDIDKIFESDFTLYPNEKITGSIARSGANIATETAPAIQLEVAYIKGNTQKKTEYSRWIYFTGTIDSNEFVEMSLDKIDKTLKEISNSNNRMANYFSGNWLLTMDEMNLHQSQEATFVHVGHRRLSRHPYPTENDGIPPLRHRKMQFIITFGCYGKHIFMRFGTFYFFRGDLVHTSRRKQPDLRPLALTCPIGHLHIKGGLSFFRPRTPIYGIE